MVQQFSPASSNKPAPRKISQIMTFRNSRDGRIFHIDLQTKAVEKKVITAAVDGKVRSVTIQQ